MTKEKKYSEKLKDPRWQKMRLKILERDNWTCVVCSDNESTLHIHHKYYEKKSDPWDSSEDALITLCESCHETESFERKEYEEILLKELKRFFTCSDLCDLTEALYTVESVKNSEHFMSYIINQIYPHDLQKRIDEHIQWQIDNDVR